MIFVCDSNENFFGFKYAYDFHYRNILENLEFSCKHEFHNVKKWKRIEREFNRRNKKRIEELKRIRVKMEQKSRKSKKWKKVQNLKELTYENCKKKATKRNKKAYCRLFQSPKIPSKIENLDFQQLLEHLHCKNIDNHVKSLYFYANATSMRLKARLPVFYAYNLKI